MEERLKEQKEMKLKSVISKYQEENRLTGTCVERGREKAENK